VSSLCHVSFSVKATDNLVCETVDQTTSSDQPSVTIWDDWVIQNFRSATFDVNVSDAMAYPSCVSGGTSASEAAIHDDQQSSSTSPSPSPPSAVPPPESTVPSPSSPVQSVSPPVELSAPSSFCTDRERYESRFISLFGIVTSNNLHASCTKIVLLYVLRMRMVWWQLENAQAQPESWDSMWYGQVHG
jgi:hypothetical protein